MMPPPVKHLCAFLWSMLDMRAMKHKPSLLEECGSARLPAVNYTSALRSQAKTPERYVDGGPGVKPPPEETQGGVFLIASLQYYNSP